MSSPSTDSHSTAVRRQPSSDTVRASADESSQAIPQNQNDPGSASELPGHQQNACATTGSTGQSDVHAQADDSGATSSARDDKQPPQSPSSTADPTADDGKVKEKQGDTGSLNTVTTNTPTRHSPRKANKTSVSEGASTSTSTNIYSATTNGKARVHTAPAPIPAFFAKLFRRLVPCIPVTMRNHDLDLDTHALAVREKEKPISTNEAINDTLVPLDKPGETASQTSGATPSTSVPQRAPPLAIPPAPPTPDGADVLAPSTPTLLPKAETEGVTSGAVQPPGSTGESVLSAHTQHVHAHVHDHSRTHTRDVSADEDESDETSFTEDEDVEESTPVEDNEDEEDRLILNGGAGIPIGPDGVPRPLLPPIAPQHAGRKCLVLDLDETLVHSSFKSIQSADYVVPVEIEFHWHNVYVIKRPGVDNFLKKMGEIYEVVVFTASLSKYADPVLDKLDIHQVVSHRLFRESCYNHKGNYVKDLSQLGRPIADTIILDNSPASYIFHPNNAVPVSSWFNDPHDTELTDLVPFLADLSSVDDVRGVLDGGL